MLPCGIGPNNYNFGRYGLAYTNVQSLVGNVQTNFTGYVNSGTNNVNDLNRYVLALSPGATDPPDPDDYEPTLDPSASFTNTLTRGLAYSGSIAQGNHTFSLSGSTYSATNSSMPTAGSQYVTAVHERRDVQRAISSATRSSRTIR